MKPLHAFALLLISAAAATAQTNLWQNSGNIGIGTTNPQSKLDVNSGNGIISFGAGSDENIGANIYYSSGWKHIANDYATIVTMGDGAYHFYTGDIGAADSHVTLSDRLTILNSGNVGIGTTAPMQKLSLVGGTFNVGAEGDYYGAWLSGGQSVDSYLGLGAWHSQAGYIKWFNAARRLAIYTTSVGEPITLQENGGNVGIGTTSPGTKLYVAGVTSIDTGNFGGNALLFNSTRNFGQNRNWAIFTNELVEGDFGISESNVQQGVPQDANTRFYIRSGGNIGIGTTAPTEKLSVNGRIRAKEVIVETTGWSDHVFAKGYKLASLSEVEQQIQQQGHLPGVPSATEVAEKGVSVGDMQAVLLAKVEELTLHLIAQEKNQAAQQQEIVRLRATEKEVVALRAEVEQLRQTK